MGMQCAICAKKPVVGGQLTYRGVAKYLRGIGRKITGTNHRTFRPNLQNVRCVLDGVAKRRRVCTGCIRSGAVVKPVVAKPFAAKPQ